MANGVWSAAEALTGKGADYLPHRHRAGRARAASGWSGRRRWTSNFDLYARAFDGKRWSPAERLTTAANSDIYHTLAADAAGHLYLAWQSARSGNFDIYLRVYDGRTWSQEMQVSDDPANDWEPALAVAPDGARHHSLGHLRATATTTWWRARIARAQLGPLTADRRQRRVRIARVGAVRSRRAGSGWPGTRAIGTGARTTATRFRKAAAGCSPAASCASAVLENGRLQETTAPIADAVPEEFRQVFHQPVLVLDGGGNPWVFFRIRTNLPQQTKGEGPVPRRCGGWKPPRCATAAGRP